MEPTGKLKFKGIEIDSKKHAIHIDVYLVDEKGKVFTMRASNFYFELKEAVASQPTNAVDETPRCKGCDELAQLKRSISGINTGIFDHHDVKAFVYEVCKKVVASEPPRCKGCDVPLSCYCDACRRGR